MIAEPDWGTLADIDFLIHKRMAEHLNAALSALSLIGAPNTGGTPPEYWQKRAIDQVMKALGTYNAWSGLIRHKMGETFQPQHMRPFHASELLEWLASELQLNNVPHLKNDLLLWGNPETLKEALLLLHSCAFTLGPSVRLVGKSRPEGMWFQVRYKTLPTSAPPTTLDALLSRLQGNWRAHSAAFELKRARDFLVMNNSELTYTVGDGYCELTFFVKAAHSRVIARPMAVETARMAASDTDTTPMFDRKPGLPIPATGQTVPLPAPAPARTPEAVPMPEPVPPARTPEVVPAPAPMPPLPIPAAPPPPTAHTSSLETPVLVSRQAIERIVEKLLQEPAPQ